MIKLKDLLTERTDFQYVASELVKNYRLKSKVKFGTGSEFADYVPETDTIKLRRSYPNVKEFLITVLHEIAHALDAKRLGVKKFDMLVKKGIDKFIKRPVKNHIGKKWIEKQKLLKAR